MGYEKEWNEVYGLNKDPVRKYILFPLLKTNYWGKLSNKTILDAGCGNGNLLSMFKECNFKHAVGVDISNDFLSTAIKYVDDERVEFIQSDLLNALPFENESFNIIFSVFVFNELPYIENHVSELSRVLSKDGEIAVVMTHPFFAMYYSLQERFTGKKNEKLIGLKGYFDKSKCTYNFTLANATATFYQYTFEDILNPIYKYGLCISEVLELKTDNDNFLKLPQYWETKDIPKYLFLRIKKQFNIF